MQVRIFVSARHNEGLRCLCSCAMSKKQGKQLLHRRGGIKHSFGVPLDAERKGAAGNLDGFDGAVQGAGADHYLLSGDMNALVVEAIDGDGISGCLVEKAVRGDGDSVAYIAS